MTTLKFNFTKAISFVEEYGKLISCGQITKSRNLFCTWLETSNIILPKAMLLITISFFQNIINRQWYFLSDDEKVEIRMTLLYELTTKHERMLYFIRNKLAALIVSVARNDWPHMYPDFFNNIVEV